MDEPSTATVCSEAFTGFVSFRRQLREDLAPPDHEDRTHHHGLDNHAARNDHPHSIGDHEEYRPAPPHSTGIGSRGHPGLTISSNLQTESTRTTAGASRAEDAAQLKQVADFFDGFAAVDDRWRSRNPTYHRLIESVCASSCRDGRLRARDRQRPRRPARVARAVARGRRRRQPADGRARRARATPASSSSAPRARPSCATRPSTTSSSPTSSRTSTTCSRSSRTSPRMTHPRHAGRHQLVQPALAAGDPACRAPAAEAAQAAPQLGRARGRPQPARPRGLEVVTRRGASCCRSEIPLLSPRS